MATFVPFNCFSLDLGKGIHKFHTDTLKVYLTNVAPGAGNTVYNTPADLSTVGGYTAGGLTLGTNTWSQTDGVASLVAGNNLTWTATSGFGPFRYAVLYNDTAAAKNLIGYWDNGSSISIAAGGTFEGNFGATVLTLDF